MANNRGKQTSCLFVPDYSRSCLDSSFDSILESYPEQFIVSDVEEGYFLFFLEQEVPFSFDSFQFIGFLVKKEENEKRDRKPERSHKKYWLWSKIFWQLLYFLIHNLNGHFIFQCFVSCFVCVSLLGWQQLVWKTSKNNMISKRDVTINHHRFIFRVKIDSNVEDEWMTMKIVRMRDVVKIDISYLVLHFPFVPSGLMRWPVTMKAIPKISETT